MSGVRKHFWEVVVSGAGGGSRPRKNGICGCIPAVVEQRRVVTGTRDERPGGLAEVVFLLEEREEAFAELGGRLHARIVGTASSDRASGRASRRRACRAGGRGRPSSACPAPSTRRISACGSAVRKSGRCSSFCVPKARGSRAAARSAASAAATAGQPTLTRSDASAHIAAARASGRSPTRPDPSSCVPGRKPSSRSSDQRGIASRSSASRAASSGHARGPLRRCREPVLPGFVGSTPSRSP